MHMINLPTAAGGGTVEINLELFSDDIKQRLMLHGAQQKVADSVANAKAKGWSVDDCKARCQEVLDNLANGDWSGRARVASFDDFLSAAFRNAIKKRDKECTGKVLTDRIAAAKANPANAAFIAAQRKVWDAMQNDVTIEV